MASDSSLYGPPQIAGSLLSRSLPASTALVLHTVRWKTQGRGTGVYVCDEYIVVNQ